MAQLTDPSISEKNPENNGVRTLEFSGIASYDGGMSSASGRSVQHNFTGFVNTGAFSANMEGEDYEETYDTISADAGFVVKVSPSLYRVELVSGAKMEVKFAVSLRDSKPSKVTVRFESAADGSKQIISNRMNLPLADYNKRATVESCMNLMFGGQGWKGNPPNFPAFLLGRADGEDGEEKYACDYGPNLLSPDQAMGLVMALFMSCEGEDMVAGGCCVVQ
jgi:hypothetical protein